MDERGQDGLQRMPQYGTLATSGSRTSLIARGRRDAAAASAPPGYERAVQAYAAGDFDAAARAFELAAEQGHAESQYVLSTMVDAGLGCRQNAAEAARWEAAAAEQGHAYAQANLSFRLYDQGDFEGAFAWCRRAAYGRLAWAQYNVGLMYRRGEGVVQSDAEAARWYRMAAEQDFAVAQEKLAAMHSSGLGVSRDDAEAARWYRRAADLGNSEAQFQLGHLYAVGQGVDLDYVGSRYWIRKAAAQGYPQAMQELKRREYRDA